MRFNGAKRDHRSSLAVTLKGYFAPLLAGVKVKGCTCSIFASAFIGEWLSCGSMAELELGQEIRYVKLRTEDHRGLGSSSLFQKPHEQGEELPNRASSKRAWC